MNRICCKKRKECPKDRPCSEEDVTDRELDYGEDDREGK